MSTLEWILIFLLLIFLGLIGGHFAGILLERVLDRLRYGKPIFGADDYQDELKEGGEKNN